MPCPICGSNAEVSAARRTPSGGEAHHVPCQRCGPYFATEEALADLPGTHRGDVDLIARIAHGVRRMQRAGREPVIYTDIVERFIKTPLPALPEQLNNLITWLGESSAGPGEPVAIQGERDLFIVGAKSVPGFYLVITEAEKRGYIQAAHTLGAHTRSKLTFHGWAYLDELRRGKIASRKAFMAMKYGDTVLDRIVDDHFRPAVALAGFALTRLDDEPRAGLIDDRLRVEIRTARFLIADLTHGNQGAYWEAGYAEGLGKPVVYTCEREQFKKGKTHFDTNHHLTVVWDAKNPAEAAEELKATIRATLPDEATLTD